MENASNALIIAASVLLGIMLLSLATYLFTTYARYSSDAYAQMEASKIAEFNKQFLKYEGKSEYTDENGNLVNQDIKCTAHDIITLANFAEYNNKNYEIYDLKKYDDTTYYVQIDVGKSKKNLETWTNEKKIQFITENSNDNTEQQQLKYYYIKKINISPITKRVNYVYFEEVK